MSKQSKLSLDTARLRSLAEQTLADRSKAAAVTAMDDKKLLHELQVHQIELEMLLETLNDNLNRAQAELEVSLNRYFDLYDLAPVGYLTVERRGLILEANLTAANLLGVTRKSLINQPISGFILASDREAYRLHHANLMESAKPQLFELHLLKQDGSPFWVRVEMNRSRDTAANAAAAQELRVVLIDIGEQKANDEYPRRAAAIFEAAREGVMVTDANNRILAVNQAFCELTGYSAAEVMGKNPRMLQSGRQDKDFYSSMRAEIDRNGYWQGEIWNRRKNGEVYPQLLSISAIRDEHKQVSQYVALFSDITRLKKAEARLDYLAYHDHLTGLPNRLLLFSRLEHCIDLSRRERKSAALLMMDLDRFKDVNDSFGHLARRRTAVASRPQAIEAAAHQFGVAVATGENQK